MDVAVTAPVAVSAAGVVPTPRMAAVARLAATAPGLAVLGAGRPRPAWSVRCTIGVLRAEAGGRSLERLDFPLVLPGLTRRSLVWETRFIALAFLWPSVTAAVVVFAESTAGAHQTRFPVLVSGHELFNLIFGMISYLPLAAVVPIALYLLARTGQTPRWLGLVAPRYAADVLPGLGLAAASFGAEIAMIIPLTPLVLHHSTLLNQVPVGHVTSYYVVYGLLISLVTAVTEEVLMNGYLVTRLNQLGWSANSIVILCVVLRTCYHLYYGIGFLLTIPFTWFVTRSFQKHRRLTRVIAAHFIFDGSLLILSLTSGPWKFLVVAPFAVLALISAGFARKQPAGVGGKTTLRRSPTVSSEARRATRSPSSPASESPAV